MLFEEVKYILGPMPPGITTVHADIFLSGDHKDRAQRYEKYFESLKPKTTEDILRRALFAFASVHTSWLLNCRLYELLWPLDWIGNTRRLMDRIMESGAGLHKNRTRYIMKFVEEYTRNPATVLKTQEETWFEYRDRLNRKILGLGLAKCAFLSELIYFEKSDTTCFDTHMIQLFGKPATQYHKSLVPDKLIKWSEIYWAQQCREKKLSPVTARWIYWDTKQRKSDSRYWSKVLEGDPRGLFTGGQLLLFPTETMETCIRL